MAASKTKQNPVWTTRRLISWTGDYFARHGFEHPRLAAEMLLADVLETDRLKLYTDPDRPASPLERAAYRERVQRAARGEPVDYLIGHGPFFSLLFEVTPDVMIPRPSTETLVEHVLQHARRTPGFHRPLVADIGTGSGAIAVSIAKHLSEARVLATDVSRAALRVARANARRHGVEQRVEWREGALLAPLQAQRPHYIVANPPYIGDAAWARLPTHIRAYEPSGALYGGPDGMDILRPLIRDAPAYLPEGGQLVLEIGDEQNSAVRRAAEATEALGRIQVLADHEGLPRVLVAERNAK
jgi:release factor glutamine methyltransferase